MASFVSGQTRRTLLVDLLGSCEDTWERYSESGKRLKQTLWLTIICKVGGNQTSLVQESLLAFLSLFKPHHKKYQVLKDTKS